MSLDAVVKLGGSLLAAPELPRLMRAMADVAATRSLVLVPGGGPFADAVRQACRSHDPGPSAAHWMAILGMDQTAHMIAGLVGDCALVTDPSQAGATQPGRLAVLAPFAWLRREDPLPHGWDVTSDSIAAWTAARLGARRVVLLKSVEGVSSAGDRLLAQTSPEVAAEAGLVDAHFPRVLPASLECWIVSGRHPERVAELLGEGATRGTRLHGPGLAVDAGPSGR
jgi:aspartokinase-like uncharacterized kinase